MACCLLGANPLSEPMLTCQLFPKEEEVYWKVNQNLNISIQENPFEKAVCKMAAILSRPQCVED